MCPMWDEMGGGMMAAMMLFWGFFLLVFLALAVAALIWIIRQLRGGSQPAALAELDRRYAAGEIGRDEYRAAREDLRR